MTTNMKSFLNKSGKRTGKGLLILLFSIGLVSGASAQRGGFGHGGGGFHGGGGYYSHSYIGVGLGFGYSPFYPYYGLYSPFGYPYGYPPYYYGRGVMPSRLGFQIDDIKNDYSARIKETRQDKSVPRKERRMKITQLKHDRDAAIIQARKDYYYNSRRNSNNNNRPQQGNGNSQPNNGNGQNNGNTPNNNGQQPNNNNQPDQPEYQSK